MTAETCGWYDPYGKIERKQINYHTIQYRLTRRVIRNTTSINKEFLAKATRHDNLENILEEARTKTGGFYTGMKGETITTSEDLTDRWLATQSAGITCGKPPKTKYKGYVPPAVMMLDSTGKKMTEVGARISAKKATGLDGIPGKMFKYLGICDGPLG